MHRHEVLAETGEARHGAHRDDRPVARCFELGRAAGGLTFDFASDLTLHLLGDAVGLFLGVAVLGFACQRVLGALGGEGVADWELNDALGQRSSFCGRRDRELHQVDGDTAQLPEVGSLLALFEQTSGSHATMRETIPRAAAGVTRKCYRVYNLGGSPAKAQRKIPLCRLI